MPNLKLVQTLKTHVTLSAWGMMPPPTSSSQYLYSLAKIFFSFFTSDNSNKKNLLDHLDLLWEFRIQVNDQFHELKFYLVHLFFYRYQKGKKRKG